MRFDELSLDCSSIIWALLDVHDLNTLYVSGNRQIITKIVNGASKLSCDPVLWRKVAFPRIVTSLPRLTDLRVSIPKPTLYTSIPGFEWSLIPSSLTTLDVAISCAQFRTPPSPLPSLPLLTTLRLQIGGDWSVKGILPDFSTWTPRLESLRVHRGPQYRPICETFSTNILPSTLTELDWQAIPLIISSSDITWPPSLTRLDLNLDDSQLSTTSTAESSTWFQLLPMSLTSFNINSSTNKICESTIDWSLPNLPNLHHLGLLWCREVLQSASEIALLPRTLKSLAIFMCTDSRQPGWLDVALARIRSLPPILTSLELPYHGSLPPEAALYACLPRTLRHLKSDDHIVPPTCPADVQPFLPPELSFHFATEQCDPILISYLHLTDLRLTRAASFTNLPPNLKRLHAVGSNLDSSSLALLPPGLEELCIRYLRIKDEELILLPRGLKVLKTETWRSLTFSSGSSLPRTLQVLELHRIELRNVQQWFSGLPTTLTKLRAHLAIPDETTANDFQLSRLSSLSDLSLRFDKTLPKPGYSTILRNLPPFLTRLGLPASPDKLESGISKADIALLPRGLCHLKLPLAQNIKKSCEKFLPPHLTQVIIGHRSEFWSNPERPNAGFEPPRMP